MKPKLLSLFTVLIFVRICLGQTLSFTPVITGLSQPLQIVHAGDGSNRLFVVQKGGTIKIYNASYGFLGDFLTVTGIATSGEQGLLSLAFHPQYASNGFFYVYYNTSGGDLEIARYQVSANANVANAGSKVVVITIPHPTNTNHNGGELHFGSDGYLYLTTGDGGSAGDPSNNAQNTTRLLGKMLRFNVNTSPTAPYYTIPAGNPYGNEIYALGLRNPFRWSFDRLTGDVWIGDVGQDVQEEINYRTAATALGTNYGWRCYEGTNPYNTAGCLPASNYTSPVFTYATQNPSAAITGGVVYRGAIYPDLYGYYVAADFYSGNFYKLIPNGSGGWAVTTQATTFTGVADFGEAENGELYAVSLTAGSVSTVTSGAPVPVRLTDFTGQMQEGTAVLKWKTSSEINTSKFVIEYSKNGSSFSALADVNARNAATGTDYSYAHKISVNGIIYYRLRIVDVDGSYAYSQIVKLVGNNGKRIINPTVISNGILQVSLPEGMYNKMEVVNALGVVVIKRDIDNYLRNIPLNVSKGVYVVRFSGHGRSVVERIVVL